MNYQVAQWRRKHLKHFGENRILLMYLLKKFEMGFEALCM
jgi:hypothetical protein